MPGWECVFESVCACACVYAHMTAAISWRLQSSRARIPVWTLTSAEELLPTWTLEKISTSPNPHGCGIAGTGWVGRVSHLHRVQQAGRQPQLPSCPPAASPSPTCTEFPTCLSVSDSSCKILG